MWRSPDLLRDNCLCESRLAQCAGPIFTSSMANYRIQNYRSYQVTKLLAASKRSEKKQIQTSKLATALAFRGLAGLMANAFIVDRTGKICVIERVSPVTPSMVAMPSLLLPMLDFVFVCLTIMMMSRLRRYFVRG